MAFSFFSFRSASLRPLVVAFGSLLVWTLVPRSAQARPVGQGPPPRKNVFGEPLAVCCQKSMTGFYRDGYCRVGPSDGGRHGVCAEVTAEFLAYTKQEGNDLSAPVPAARFPGLTPGDRWCVCVSRWLEALKAGKAPPVALEATDEDALRDVPLAVLRQHAIGRAK